MQAMILAAGFGTRLLPHTRLKPKPLFPVLNEPLLLLTIRRLQRCGFDHIIVNCHHLRQQIAEQLRGVDGVVVQQEETILGTGGGLRRALAMMRDEPLLVTNGDIYHTIDYQSLHAAHCTAASPVTLAMHDCARFNSVRVAGGRVVEFRSRTAGEKLLAFTGLSVLNPEILSTIEDGPASCIIDHYRRLLHQGETLRVFRSDGCFWTDMGTLRDYLELHAGLLDGTIPRWREFAYTGSDPILVDGRARLSGRTWLRSWCAIGEAVGRDVSLSGVVVWDGVCLPDGYRGENMLISESPTGRETGSPTEGATV